MGKTLETLKAQRGLFIVKIESKKIGKWSLIEVQGNLDSYLDSFKLKDHVVKEITKGNNFIVFDCSTVEYANTIFISRILLIKHLIEDRNGEFCIILSHFLKQLFEKINMDGVIKTFDSYLEFKKHISRVKNA